MNKTPNILFIMNDHQAYFNHINNRGEKPKTPNFDELAKEGVKFENAYCSTPLCGPVRRSIVSGLYPHTHKNYYNDSNIPYDEESYLRILARNGYKNYYYGKWHAGPKTPLAEHNCEGFSCEGYGNPYITKEYKEYIKENNLPQARHFVEKDFSTASHKESHFFEKMEEQKEYCCEDSWCGEHAVGKTITPKETHESFFLANLAIKKLEELAKNNTNQPWHLRLDFWGPHEPFFPTQEFIDMYDPSKIEEYGNFSDDLADKAAVHSVDENNHISKDGKIIIPNPLPWSQWQIILSRVYAQISMIDAAGGLVLNKIKELGLDENTLIIWTTDHGDAIASHGGHFDKCSYMSQEVMRIPLAMKWKNVIEANQNNNNLVCSLDFPQTILDAAGLQFNQKKPGESLLKLFTPEKTKWREGLMCETYGHGYIERIPARMYVYKNWKYVWYKGQKEELYNIEEDPYELINLAYDDKYSSIKKQLKEMLNKDQIFSDDPIKID
ncbi:MAG: sulfatase-like hydrolase/transferase [Pleomorphochaeta sp.]